MVPWFCGEKCIKNNNVFTIPNVCIIPFPEKYMKPLPKYFSDRTAEKERLNPKEKNW